MTKKKNILIVAIIAVLVVAISGVSFAAWQAFVKPADQTWNVTANNPGQLKVNGDPSIVTPSNYNGEAAYTTSVKINLTATVGMTVIVPTVVITADLAGDPVEYVLVEGTPTAGVTDGVLAANVAKDVTITVTFPDLSNSKYYGATFKIVVTLDKQA